jgi:hypothetical protein
MTNLANAATNFLNQNFYGFLLLMVAAFFFYEKNNEAAQAFSYIGSALMGIRQLTPTQPTISTESMSNTTVTTPKV